MKLDWRSKYDFVVSLCYTGNAKRVPPLDAELARVGLAPDVRIWNVPCPFERKLLAGVAATDDARKPCYLNSGLGHYRAVKTAHELGAARVLVLEDDVRFLKDLDKLAEAVANTPDCGVVLYDCIGSFEETAQEMREKFDATARHGWTDAIESPLSLACYGMDRDAMEWFIECFELAFTGRGILKVVDQWLAVGMRRTAGIGLSVAWPLACVQAPVRGSASNSISTGEYFGWYSDAGVDVSNYAS